MAKILTSGFFTTASSKMQIDKITYSSGQYIITGSGFKTKKDYLYVLADNNAYVPDSYTDSTIILTLGQNHIKFRVANENSVSNTFETENPNIIFQFTGTSFSIPCSRYTGSSASTGYSYSWTVYVDNVLYGAYSGTGSFTSAGISLTGLTDGTHTVRIRPTNDTYSAGWGNAFGFYSGTSGANATANKAKLTAVLSDPDWAYMLDATRYGDYFRAYQYYGCINLTQILDEEDWRTDAWAAHYYRYCQYYGCTNLANAAVETSSTRSNVGTHFRACQYAYCPNLRIGTYIHGKDFAMALNGAEYTYSQMFYLSSANTTADTMPLYYLSDGTTASVTNRTPSADKNYVTNRTGITGYSSMNSYWR
jgi:hypothetical protein